MDAAILDQRIKATVLICSLGAYHGHGVELDELCWAQVVPGILQWAEMGDVVGLLATRPLFAENARNDECFHWSYTAPTLERLREVYHVAGAEEHLVLSMPTTVPTITTVTASSNSGIVTCDRDVDHPSHI